MAKLLLVEDNNTIIMGLDFLFKEEGYTFDIAKSCKEADKLISKNKYDIVLLDVFLPDGNGFDICKKLKKEFNTPVIFLTAKDEEKDIVYGFDIGADDYVIKPFRNRELISRINNVLRRNNKGRKIRYKDEEEVLLTKLEYTILLCLFQNQNILITREKLLNDIWDVAGNFVEDNTLTVYIKRIREKIGDSSGSIIKTIRGMGYRVGD